MSAILRSFVTTASREAFRFGVNHVGRFVTDQEANRTYLVFGEGLGADVCFPLDEAAFTPGEHASSHYEGGDDEVDITQLGGYSGDTGTFLRGDGTFATTGIGGIQSWYPDAPPASAHSCDDEMDGGSVDAKWTEWDPSDSVTFSMDTTRHMLKCVQTGNGGVRWAGLYQAVPASEFAIYAKVHPIYASPQTNGMGLGIFVSDDIATNPTTADFREIDLGMSTNSFGGIQTRTWTAYNGTASATFTKSLFPTPYLRIRCNGTTFLSESSPDGVTWFTIDNATLGFTPTHMGICFVVTQNTIEGTGLVSFFRVFSGAGTSGYHSTHIGRYI